MRHSIGATKRYMLVRHDTGFPGRPKTGTPSTSAKIVGFPGFSCSPSKWMRPARAEDLEGEVALADRTPARRTTPGLLSGSASNARVSASRSSPVRGATTGSPPCAMTAASSAVVFASKICPSRSRPPGATISSPVERIATRGRAKTSSPVDAERGRDGKPRRCQHRALGKGDLASDEVAARSPDVLAWRYRLEDADAIAVARRVLDHHDRVGAVGNRRARRDAGARPGHDRVGRRRAREDRLDLAQLDSAIRRSAARVGRAYRVAIHRRPRERRHVAIGDQRIRHDAP